MILTRFLKGIIAAGLPSILPLLVRVAAAGLLPSGTYFNAISVNMLMSSSLSWALLGFPYVFERFSKSDYSDNAKFRNDSHKSIFLFSFCFSFLIGIVAFLLLCPDKKLKLLIAGSLSVASNVYISYEVIRLYTLFRFTEYSLLTFAIGFAPLAFSCFFNETLAISLLAYSVCSIFVVVLYLFPRFINLFRAFTSTSSLTRSLSHFFCHIFRVFVQSRLALIEFWLKALPLSSASLLSNICMTYIFVFGQYRPEFLVIYSVVLSLRDLSLRASTYIVRSSQNILYDGSITTSSGQFNRRLAKLLLACVTLATVSGLFCLFVLPLWIGGNITKVEILGAYRVLLLAAVVFEAAFNVLYLLVSLKLDYLYSFLAITLPRDLAGIAVVWIGFPLLGPVSVPLSLFASAFISLLSVIFRVSVLKKEMEISESFA